MKKLFIALFITLLIGFLIYPNKKEEKIDMNNNNLIPRTTLFGNPERALVQISPNGQYLTYLANLENVMNVFIEDLNNPTSKKPLTADKERGIQFYTWLYDNSHIIYLKDDGGDENWSIHAVNIETKEDKILTAKKVRAQFYNISEKYPNEIMIGLNDRDQSYHDLYRLNVKTGEKKLIIKNEQKFGNYILDDNFKLRFVSRSTNEGSIAYLEAIETAGSYEFKPYITFSEEDYYTSGILGLTKDGKTFYMLDSKDRDLNVLKEVNTDTKIEKIIAEAAKAEIDRDLVTSPITHEIQAYYINYLKKEWYFIDHSLKNHVNKLEETLKGEITINSRSFDDNLWIVTNMRDNGPIGYYLYNKINSEIKFLFENRQDLNKYKLATTEGVIIKARDGLELPSYLTRPVNANGPTPLILHVHGGPWARDSWGFNSYNQWFANRGYSVLQVNFRSSRGFGKDFTAKGNLEWGAKMHNDLLDAVKWAIDQKIADPNNIAIYGGSYGGYAALWGATNSSDIFKCAIDIVGPSNLETLLASIPAYWESFREKLYKQVGDPRTDEGKKLLKERSPLTHADKIKIPILIAQGEKDPRVKQAESEQIVNAMKAKNIPYIYMLFLNEGHGFVKPENRIAFTAITEYFLHKNLGGKFEEITTELDNTTLEENSKKELLIEVKK